MSAHRYWRLFIYDNNSGGSAGCAISEIGLRTTAGGSSVATGGTASVSSVWSGSAANAFDGNTSTDWQGASHIADWAAYDLGSGNEKDIVELAVTTSLGSGWAPKNAALQYSDDNATWLTKIEFYGQTGWAANEQRVFSGGVASTPGAHRYWRLYCRRNNGGGSNGTDVAELSLRTSVGGSSVATGGTATASSTWTGSAANAFDGNTSTLWEGADHNTDWLAYDLGSGVTRAIVEIAITIGTTTAAGPKDFALQYSDDNSGWREAHNWNNQTGWSSGETRTFTTSSASAAAGRPVVFVCT